jgi:hypothetical protein
LVIPSQQSQMMQQQNLMEEPRPSPFRLHQTNVRKKMKKDKITSV